MRTRSEYLDLRVRSDRGFASYVAEVSYYTPDSRIAVAVCLEAIDLNVSPIMGRRYLLRGEALATVWILAWRSTAAVPLTLACPFPSTNRCSRPQEGPA